MIKITTTCFCTNKELKRSFEYVTFIFVINDKIPMLFILKSQARQSFLK